ncbi:DEAD DEAH box helicase protein [Rutstroemia sp. NJR-2017a BVV2]|nr:DEAD DEAH box helicase protein [Rutstroemia sp. NJR-2017a BVV2]
MSPLPSPSTRRPARRGRGGRRNAAHPAHSVNTRARYTQAAHNVSSPPTTDSPRVATPPLTAPIPLDTPRFTDLAEENLLAPVLIQTITEDLKFDHMMPVQAATLRPLLADRVDCLAQAKTGTGKTIAFLLPAIQTLINRNRRPEDGVSLLVISPTRELAQQIAKEATQLLQRLPQYKICVAIGGTNKDTEQRRILAGCNILIATPGRLNDHLGDEGFDYQFRNLDTLVLDEADRLLDMGFMNALKDIFRHLPNKEKSNRQGMLFSATIAPHVENVAHLVLSKGYKFISTIPEGEANTHERIPQHLIVVPNFSSVAAAMVGSIRKEMQLNGPETFKAIVFAPTAALVDLYHQILSSIQGLPPVTLLHSRLSQSKRTSTTNEYRAAKNGILIATDVVARGMDFPNVTNVFQVGVPADKESYIHRLGRTGRAGAEGRGTFIIAQPETFFSTWTLKEIDFQEIEPDLSAADEIFNLLQKMGNHSKTYQAWLGYYKNHNKALKWTNEELVRQGNIFARDGLGAPETPTITKRTVGKMGLKGVPGLVVVPDPPREPNGSRGSKASAVGSKPSAPLLNASVIHPAAERGLFDDDAAEDWSAGSGGRGRGGAGFSGGQGRSAGGAGRGRGSGRGRGRGRGGMGGAGRRGGGSQIMNSF